MNRLILMRHAKTEAWHEGIDDHGRALLPRGVEDARLMAEELVKRGWRPSSALVSTARRARETWRYAAPAWSGQEPVYEDDLYLASPGTLESALGGCEWTGALLVIGHNPGIHEFACSLARDGGAADDFCLAQLFEKFPTGAAALFQGEGEGAFHMAGYQLMDVIRPKDLRDSPAS